MAHGVLRLARKAERQCALTLRDCPRSPDLGSKGDIESMSILTAQMHLPVLLNLRVTFPFPSLHSTPFRMSQLSLYCEVTAMLYVQVSLLSCFFPCVQCSVTEGLRAVQSIKHARSSSQYLQPLSFYAGDLAPSASRSGPLSRARTFLISPLKPGDVSAPQTRTNIYNTPANHLNHKTTPADPPP